MRIRLPELMERKGLTAHGLAAGSAGRISITTAYRLAENRGALKVLKILDALCDVLGVEPNELLERGETPKAKAPAKRPAKKAKRAR